MYSYFQTLHSFRYAYFEFCVGKVGKVAQTVTLFQINKQGNS